MTAFEIIATIFMVFFGVIVGVLLCTLNSKLQDLDVDMDCEKNNIWRKIDRIEDRIAYLDKECRLNKMHSENIERKIGASEQKLEDAN